MGSQKADHGPEDSATPNRCARPPPSPGLLLLSIAITPTGGRGPSCYWPMGEHWIQREPEPEPYLFEGMHAACWRWSEQVLTPPCPSQVHVSRFMHPPFLSLSSGPVFSSPLSPLHACHDGTNVDIVHGVCSSHRASPSVASSSSSLCITVARASRHSLPPVKSNLGGRCVLAFCHRAPGL